MQTLRVVGKTDKQGTLLLRFPLGQPETEFDVAVVMQPSAAATPGTGSQAAAWPPGYVDLAGSICDATFVRQPQGELPKAVDLD